MGKTPGDVKGILGPSEKVELYIKQKVFHPAINIDAVALTNERIILRHPHYPTTAKDYTDFPYTDFDTVSLHKGILRSTLIFAPKPGTKASNLKELSKLPNKKAKSAYGIIRENILRYQTPFAGISAMPPVLCKKCGAGNTANSKRCSSCGATL